MPLFMLIIDTLHSPIYHTNISMQCGTTIFFQKDNLRRSHEHVPILNSISSSVALSPLSKASGPNSIT